MRSISSALSTALGAPVQKPAVLVHIGFSPSPLRWSSGPTITWGGYTWQAADVAIDGLRVEALRVSGSIQLGNTDSGIGLTCMTQGVQDRAITIYAFDAAATASPDVVWICEARASGATIDERFVRIDLRHRAEMTPSPRTVVGDATGFTQRLPSGTVLRINGVDYRLERPK